MPSVHIICNAHIDPVWQWEWEEGAAATVTTFRAAADFCDEFDDFVFCHNEAKLYQWIEEYDPPLFERIRAHVRSGKWRIMGGWYLQPDCNMPSGESLIRQIKLGREYFAEKFGARPETAINLDPFGHSRGLVQILKKSGFKSYLFMRPSAEWLDLPANDFTWVGYDGSRVSAHRLDGAYNSQLGCALDKIKEWLAERPKSEIYLIPWGVGNHGGGASRKDISDINAYRRENPNAGIRHSSPDEYFTEMLKLKGGLPEYSGSLKPFAVGCYTTQTRVKRAHRKLEGLLSATERMLSHACMAGLIEYPYSEIREAEEDLCFSEFHDILPGSSIQPAEEAALRQIDHALEILTRLRARAFFALAACEKAAAAGEYPVLAYNPFPYEITTTIECEFMLADQNWKSEFTDFSVYRNGEKIPAQVEKEHSNLPLDWRKKIVFRTALAPMQMNRFDLKGFTRPEKPRPECRETGDCFVFDSGSTHIEISKTSGMPVSYISDGFEYMKGGARLAVIKDSPDPWGMTVRGFKDEIGAFALTDYKSSAKIAGVDADELPPVRVTESGDTRIVIEASLAYGKSEALVTYKLNKPDGSVQIDVRLSFFEKDRVVKFCVPTTLNEKFVGQQAFGHEELYTNGDECVFQQWVAAEDRDRAFAVINDGVYGGSFENGEIRATLVRGAAYAAHPIYDRQILPQDRFSPRADMGERLYSFALMAGKKSDIIETVSQKAQLFNEPTFALSYFPNGSGGTPTCGALLAGAGALMTNMHKTRNGGFAARLFESAGEKRSVNIAFPLLNAESNIELNPFEIATLKISEDGKIEKTDMLS